MGGFSGATTGASAGAAVGGPVGAGIGAAAGAGIGAFTGGGPGPDPRGRSRVGDPPFGATLYEDIEFNQGDGGSDPAVLQVGLGSHQLSAVGWAGFASSWTIEPDFVLEAETEEGRVVMFPGPTEVRDATKRGLNDTIVAVRLRPKRAPSGEPPSAAQATQSEPGIQQAGGIPTGLLLGGAALLFALTQT